MGLTTGNAASAKGLGTAPNSTRKTAGATHSNPASFYTEVLEIALSMLC